MNKALITFALCAICLCVSCGTVAPKTDTAKTGPKFTMVEPPMTMTDQNEQRQWMASNYWNRFNYADTTFIGTDELHSAFGMWTMLLLNSDIKVATAAIQKMYTAAEASPLMLDELIRLGEGYFGDPNSEAGNDTLYIALLDYMIATPVFDSLQKIRPQRLKTNTLKNRVGDKAANFTWRDTKDQQGSLYAVKAPLTLLFFYTPGCETCKELFGAINNNELLKKAVDSKRLKLIAIYCDGDQKVWQDYARSINEKWTNTMTDEQFNKTQPFSIRATPSIYLLDANKKVLVRDAVSIQALIDQI